MSRSPLFQVLFSLNSVFLQGDGAGGSTGDRINLGSISLDPLEIDQQVSPFDLQLIITEHAPRGQGEGPTMTAAFQYSTSLWKRSSMERMASHFSTLLHDVVARPDARVANLDLISNLERELLFRRWNATREVC